MRRRYVLERLIGKGSFGEVYLAMQDSGGGFRTRVAIKLLDESASRSREVGRRMRDEARLMGRLRHRHIVAVHDMVQLGDRQAIVMEYVPGADLDRMIGLLLERERVIPPRAVVEVGIAVARALSAAWSATDEDGRPMKVVHRDVKPSNVRLTPDGDVKVLDFGVARFTSEVREAATRKPGWLGTERYMAPERILLEGDGAPGDVYALGATLVEMLLMRPLGRTPVREETHAPFVEEALAEIVALGRLGEAAREPVIGLLREMLQARPEARPEAPDVAARLDELLPLVGGDGLSRLCRSLPIDVEPGETLRGSTLEEGSSGGAGSNPIPAPVPVAATRASAPRWPWAAGLALIGLIAVGTLLGRPEAPSDQAAVVLPPLAPGGAGPAGAAMAAPAPPPPAPPLDKSKEMPAPVPAPAAAPAPTVAASRTVTRPVPVTPPTPPPVEAPSPPSAPAARVSRALVVVDNVDAFTVSCGDRSASGTVSARISDFQAGSCTIQARLGDRTLSGRAQIDGPREVRCRVVEKGLSCS